MVDRSAGLSRSPEDGPTVRLHQLNPVRQIRRMIRKPFPGRKAEFPGQEAAAVSDGEPRGHDHGVGVLVPLFDFMNRERGVADRKVIEAGRLFHVKDAARPHEKELVLLLVVLVSGLLRDRLEENDMRGLLAASDADAEFLRLPEGQPVTRLEPPFVGGRAEDGGVDAPKVLVVTLNKAVSEYSAGDSLGTARSTAR